MALLNLKRLLFEHNSGFAFVFPGKSEMIGCVEVCRLLTLKDLRQPKRKLCTDVGLLKPLRTRLIFLCGKRRAT